MLIVNGRHDEQVPFDDMIALLEHGSPKEALTPLHIAGVPEDSITPAVWAVQTGIFRRHGLDVDLEAQHSGSAVTAGVAGGSYQFGKSSMISMLVAFAHNVPVVIVAPGGLFDANNPNEAVIVERGLADPYRRRSSTARSSPSRPSTTSI